jgi:hypothetical protein
MKFSSRELPASANWSKVLVIPVILVLLQGCSDTGPPPDEKFKSTPVAPPKPPNVIKGGTTVKVKSIK